MVSSRLHLLWDNIRFEHTIFALPFAYIGMVLAADGLPTWRQFLLITLAMAAARTVAMSVNRLADRRIDARNVRTAGRPMASGALGVGPVLTLIVLSLVAYFWAAWSLNQLTLLLAPLGLVGLIGYSYTKRFTWLSHAWLGITDGAAAAGGWIAVTGRFELGAWLAWVAVALWVGGFDLIYACQDVKFDRREGLHSVPARFGVPAALNAARWAHALAALALLLLGLVEMVGMAYWVAWTAVAGLLVYEHSLVRPSNLSRLDTAFFNVNAYVALTMLVGVLLSELM